MNPIATKIRKLREIHGYPQEYVAFQLGVSQAAYSNILLRKSFGFSSG